jgi:hypothetical protein
MTRAPILATGTPVALATNGTVRLDGVLHVHQADHVERLGQRLGLVAEFGDQGGRQSIGRQGAGAVAGMDAGFLDMLQHAGDVDVVAVGNAVDIDLDRVIEIAVDQHRVFAGDTHGLAHVAVELGAVMHDFHGAAAEHVGGADHHRVADAVGDGFGLFGGAGDAVFGLQQR